MSKLKAWGFALGVVITFLIWPLFLTVGSAALVFFISYRLYRAYQKEMKGKQ